MANEKAVKSKTTEKKLAKLIARAWDDAEFKKRLVKDPAAVLTENGVALPEGVKLKVVEDTADVLHLVLPAKPTAALEIYDLTPEDMKDYQSMRAAGQSCFQNWRRADRIY